MKWSLIRGMWYAGNGCTWYRIMPYMNGLQFLVDVWIEDIHSWKMLTTCDTLSEAQLFAAVDDIYPEDYRGRHRYTN